MTRAGNLVKTVPPAGVNRIANTDLINVKNARAAGTKYPLVEQHNLITEYRYNTLNQVIAQKTPDAGISNFWYDRLGRLAISQNAKQQQDGKYSYTQYDEIGRISMVGQKPQTTAMTQITSRDVTGLDSWLNSTQNKEQITRTVYDVTYYKGEPTSALIPILYQRNVRNRVSYTQIFDTEPSGTSPDKWASKHKATTYYSYDIHGNVDTLVQDYGNSTENPNAMNTTIAGGNTNRWKKMVYNYDLISGKVNEVAYQPGLKDAYYHRYSYDSENRLTDVETSTDRIIWEKDARYSYYKHGPLARVIVGQQQVQGIDYAYTIQGWLKGVNSSSVADGTFDMGGDGVASSPTPIQVARDAYGFSLNYFTGDYKKIGTGADAFVNTTFNLTNVDNNVVAKPLYNGNIAAMFINIPKLGNAQLYGYKYDQLNRIKSMDAFRGFTNSSNTFTGSNPTASADYKERAGYDANGNIISYVRNGNAARNSMDNMTYAYKPGTNQLDKVVDAATDATTDYSLYNDIKQGQQNANYEYDLIGNLVRDKSADLYDPNDPQKKMIEWNVYGKISKITKITAGQTTTILYTYDAGGNRITKNVNGKTTWYVRDASGNVMSTYESEGVNAGALTQTELHMYGSSRLGINNVNNNMANVSTTPIFIRGNKLYEITNHLSNVLGTVSDKKIQHSTNGTTIDWYEPDVVTANDFYVGGMTQPGRKFAQGSSGYKYGFNGKEKSVEIYGEGNAYDFGNRIYDSRVSRWFSIDRKENIGWSSYNFAVDNPVRYMDREGDIQRDPNGKIIFTPISRPTLFSISSSSSIYTKFMTNGASGIHAQVQLGYIWTDKGNPVLVYKVLNVIVDEHISDGQGGSKTVYKTYNINQSNVSFYQTNCFGRSTVNGEFMIPTVEKRDGGVNTILQDEYKKVNPQNFQEGDIVDIGQKNKESGSYDYGSHVIRATGKYNKKGEMLFKSQFNFDQEGLKEMTLNEVVKYANTQIINPDEDGQFSSKHVQVYRKATVDVVIYPINGGPLKSKEGEKAENRISNEEETKKNYETPHN